MKKIIIARHYGFCMGVKRAISTVDATPCGDGDVTIFKEIVHNDAVVARFKKKGIGQASSIDNIKAGTVIIPAHGASPDVFDKAIKKGLKIVDATCPLVIRIQKIVTRLAENGYHILHFGDPDHDETIGIIGHAPRQVDVIQNVEAIELLPGFEGKVAITAQTTVRSTDFGEVEKAARKRYPHIKVFNTICNATEQRQQAIMELAPMIDIMLVVGSLSSANSNRLVQISKAICQNAHLINSADEIRTEWFKKDGKVEIVGLSAGASTPDFLIEGAIVRLRQIGGGEVEVIVPDQKSQVNRLVLDT